MLIESYKELAKFILDRIYKIPFKEDIMNRQNLVVALITKLSTDEAMEHLTPEKNLEFHLNNLKLLPLSYIPLYNLSMICFIVINLKSSI